MNEGATAFDTFAQGPKKDVMPGSSDRKLTSCQRFVGKMDRSPVEPEELDFNSLRDDEHLDSCCHSPDSVRLGERLYELYHQRYPHYLEKNALDRSLFGVI